MGEKRSGMEVPCSSRAAEEWEQVKGVCPLSEELVNTGSERLNIDFSEEGHREKDGLSLVQVTSLAGALWYILFGIPDSSW